MSSNHNERSLRHIEFPISKPGGSGDQTLVGIVKRDSTLFPVIGTVFNEGATAFTLTPVQSTDNGVSVPFSPLTMRSGGSLLTSIAVQPRGQVTFTIERSNAVAPTGTLTLTNQPSDTNTVTINDGVATGIFEFDSNATITGGNITVTIGATTADTLTALKDAVNASALTLVAVTLGDGRIGLYNSTLTAAGNNTITAVGANIIVTGMAGGTTGTTGTDVQDYLVFKATEGGYGKLILRNQQGELSRREAIEVP